MSGVTCRLLLVAVGLDLSLLLFVVGFEPYINITLPNIHLNTKNSNTTVTNTVILSLILKIKFMDHKTQLKINILRILVKDCLFNIYFSKNLFY